MFPESPITDAKDFWDQLNHVFETDHVLCNSYYMNLYSYVYLCCRHSSANAKLFCKRLTKVLKEHLSSRYSLLKELDGIDILYKYVLLWDQFKRQVDILNCIFSYLNQVLHVIERGGRQIYNLCIYQWEKTVFMPLCSVITIALINDIKRVKNDGSLLEKLFDSYVETASNNPEIVDKSHELIIAYLHCFTTAFGDWLECNYVEGLIKISKLLPSVEPLMEFFYEVFENFVEELGRKEIPSAKSGTKSQCYVNSISKVYEKVKKIVTDIFDNDAMFIEILDAAMVKFVNHNAVAERKPKHFAKLLVKRFDFLLRKSSNLPDDEIDERLNQAMTVFRYINDKFEFHQLYLQLRTQHVIDGAYIDDDLEAQILAKLEDICGSNYVNKLQSVNDDKFVNMQLAIGFRNRVEEGLIDTDGINLSVKVLPLRGWPFNVYKCPIPKALEGPMNAFKKYYEAKYSDRKLTYLPYRGHGDITCNAFSKKYTFNVNTRQAAILMMFNDGNVYTLMEIKKTLKVKTDVLPVILMPMIQLGLITVEDEKPGTGLMLAIIIKKVLNVAPLVDASLMSLDTKVKLNMKFFNRSRYISFM